MSLLGYLIPRIASSGEEPAATQALAYLLNASTDIAQAFVDLALENLGGSLAGAALERAKQNWPADGYFRR